MAMSVKPEPSSRAWMLGAYRSLRKEKVSFVMKAGLGFPEWTDPSPAIQNTPNEGSPKWTDPKLDRGGFEGSIADQKLVAVYHRIPSNSPTTSIQPLTCPWLGLAPGQLVPRLQVGDTLSRLGARWLRMLRMLRWVEPAMSQCFNSKSCAKLILRNMSCLWINYDEHIQISLSLFLNPSNSSSNSQSSQGPFSSSPSSCATFSRLPTSLRNCFMRIICAGNCSGHGLSCHGMPWGGFQGFRMFQISIDESCLKHLRPRSIPHKIR